MTTQDAPRARGGRLGWVVGLLCVAFVLASAAPASAQWRPVVRSCAAAAATPGCTTLTQFFGAWNVVVSPDGKHAYATAWDSGAVHVFDRNTTTGALVRKPGADGCITATAVVGCALARAIEEADDILISANGRHVYVTSWSGGVAIFDRNTTTGVLTQKAGIAGCITDSGNSGQCTDGRALGGQGALLSPDQKSIYVAGFNSLAVLSRNTTDGTLTQDAGVSGCFQAAPAPDTCTTTPVAPGGRQLAISADGKNVYAPSPSNGVLIFNRDATTGGLSLKPGAQGCITQAGGGGCAPRPQLAFTEAVVLSPNNRELYVSNQTGILTFNRNTSDGTVAFARCINDAGNLGCANGRNVAGLIYMALSPDGQDLVAVNSFPSFGLTLFSRNPANGAIARRSGPDGCLTPDGRAHDNGAFVNGACRANPAVGRHGHIRFFGNGVFYAGFYEGSRIGAFKRDFYPVCVSRSVTVPRNTTTNVPLTCTDRNGDAISRSIVQAPAAGALGAINQAAGSVFYNPFTGFSGADRFTFRATAAGLASAPATIGITVPAPPPKPPKRIKVGVSFIFDAFSDRTVFRKLQVKGVPRRSRVRAVCKYKGRKCAGKARKAFTKKRARGRVSLGKRFVGVDIKVGAKITVTVTKPGMIGAVKILTTRPRNEPKVVTRCVPVGSKKPKKRC